MAAVEAGDEARHEAMFEQQRRDRFSRDVKHPPLFLQLIYRISKQDETADDISQKIIFIRAVLGECLCTMIFLFVAMAVPFNMTRLGYEASELEAIAVGFMGVAVIYSFADISGANFNPAVTFATFVTGKVNFRKAIAYICAQLIGASLASLWFIISFPDGLTNIARLAVSPSSSIQAGHHIAMEFTLTFILVYVIFSVAFDTVDSQKVEVKQLAGDEQLGAKGVNVEKMVIYSTSGDSKSLFAGLSIGFQLGLLSLVGGSVSGGAYNPARAFGAAMISGIWSDQWLIWVGDLVGAACAGYCQMMFQKMRTHALVLEKEAQALERGLAAEHEATMARIKATSSGASAGAGAEADAGAVGPAAGEPSSAAAAAPGTALAAVAMTSAAVGGK